MLKPPYYPIIYVQGYAGTQDGWGSNNFKATKNLEFKLYKNNLSTAVIQLNQKRLANLTAVIRFEVSAGNYGKII